LKYFKDFELIQFNMVDDEGKLYRDIEVEDFKKNEYSLGMFMLRKK